MSTILLVYGEDDHAVISFEEMFNAQEVYENMVIEGVDRKSLTGECGDIIYCKALKFGEVDRRFVTFIIDEFVNYDHLKAKNIYFVEEMKK